MLIIDVTILLNRIEENVIALSNFGNEWSKKTKGKRNHTDTVVSLFKFFHAGVLVKNSGIAIHVQ